MERSPRGGRRGAGDDGAVPTRPWWLRLDGVPDSVVKRESRRVGPMSRSRLWVMRLTFVVFVVVVAVTALNGDTNSAVAAAIVGGVWLALWGSVVMTPEERRVLIARGPIPRRVRRRNRPA